MAVLHPDAERHKALPILGLCVLYNVAFLPGWAFSMYM